MKATEDTFRMGGTAHNASMDALAKQIAAGYEGIGNRSFAVAATRSMK